MPGSLSTPIGTPPLHQFIKRNQFSMQGPGRVPFQRRSTDKLYQSGRVTEVACWAHFRRKIFDIHQAKPTALTTDILERIGALYAVEAEVRGQPPDRRCDARQSRTGLLIADLRIVLEIDNNIAERSLRDIAVGRRNWLFAGSRVGGERAAAICTVIETCKMNGIEPQTYIADVIAKIANDWPASRWDELMPWNWQAPLDFARMAA